MGGGRDRHRRDRPAPRHDHAAGMNGTGFGLGHQLWTPTWSSTKAYTNASSLSASYRPDDPPWPPAMLHLNKSGLASVLSVRSFATYLAGSQYITWLSLSDV